jgi:hypothetical protein
LEELSKLLGRMITWVATEGIPKLGRALWDLGSSAAGQLLEGLKSIGTRIGDTIRGFFDVKLPSIKLPFVGDGPGRGRGGRALGTVQRAMQGIPGLRVTSTYRSPAQNAAIGGSPTSYHLDAGNPAVDVAGPAWALDQLHVKLARIGGRELLWRTAGHYDHLHYAHSGGVVSSSWPTLPGLRSDERPAILQVGETVKPRGGDSPGVVIHHLDVHCDDAHDLVRQLKGLRQKHRAGV